MVDWRGIGTRAFMNLQRCLKGCSAAIVMIFSWQLAVFDALLKSFGGWCLVNNSYSPLRQPLASYSGAWPVLRSSTRSRGPCSEPELLDSVPGAARAAVLLEPAVCPAVPNRIA